MMPDMHFMTKMQFTGSSYSFPDNFRIFLQCDFPTFSIESLLQVAMLLVSINWKSSLLPALDTGTIYDFPDFNQTSQNSQILCISV